MRWTLISDIAWSRRPHAPCIAAEQCEDYVIRGVCCILIESSGGCCILFHVICCAWLRVMFQIMECVASSISRWLGCKAEYYLLSCSTHSISCLQLSRITNRSLAWRKFLQDPNWCDAFNMYVCHWVRYCPWEMFAGEFFWCASLQLRSCFWVRNALPPVYPAGSVVRRSTTSCPVQRIPIKGYTLTLS